MNTASLSDQVLAVLGREGRRWSLEEETEFCPGLTDDLTCSVIDYLTRTGRWA